MTDVSCADCGRAFQMSETALEVSRDEGFALLCDHCADARVRDEETAWERVSAHAITVDGLTSIVRAYRTPEGPVVTLEGVDCDLEGELPGEYWLVAQ